MMFRRELDFYQKIFEIFCISFGLFLFCGCTRVTSTSTPPVEMVSSPLPTPNSYDETLEYLNGFSEERIAGIWSVMQNKAFQNNHTIELVICNLYYDQDSDVRENAAFALGRVKTNTFDVGSELIRVLQNDDTYHVRINAIDSLGLIGYSKAVPVLANYLYDNDIFIRISAAQSIALITKEVFPDSNSQTGYRSNEEGEPLLVIAARKWWQETGKDKPW